jgi:hypothetical protein
MTTFSNLKTYLSSAWNTFLVVISNIFGKNRNIIVTFQSDQLTEQPKTLDDLGCFDLKMFRNCPIRIKIITSSHIFILFLPQVVTLCLHFRVGREIPVVVITRKYRPGKYSFSSSGKYWEIWFLDVINFFKVATTCQNRK